MRNAEMLVGFESALAFWRAVRAGDLDLSETHIYGRAAWGSHEILDRTLRACHIDAPLDVVSSAAGERHRRKLLRDHVWRGPGAPAAQIDRVNGVEVCSMAPTFVQLASTSVDDLDLIAVAYEITGSYCLAPWSERSCVYGIEPLTTVEELVGYAMAARAVESRGAARALRLLPFVREGSASPRETDLAIMFALPRVRGGLGLDGFQLNTIMFALPRVRGGLGLDGFRLNKEIELAGRAAELLGHSSIRADFLWKGRGGRRDVMAEYESNEWHLTSKAIDRDARRREAVVSSGYAVHRITNEQLLDAGHLLTLAEEIACELGRNRHRPSKRMLDRYALVHDKIVFGSGVGLKEGRA